MLKLRRRGMGITPEKKMGKSIGRKTLWYDAEIDKYLRNVQESLVGVGIKNVKKIDVLRFIIKQNEEVNLRFSRKPKSKEEVRFY